MSKTYRIIIVDDHRLVSRSLKNLIEDHPHFKVTHQFYNGEELINYFNNTDQNPELLLLDVEMPKMNGIMTMKWLKTNRPKLKTLVLSMNVDDLSIIGMMSNGARGYISKDIDPFEFYVAMKTVIETGYYHSELTKSLEKLVAEPKKPKALRDREYEFVKYCCTDMTYKEIAGKMFLSPKTIDGYRESVFKKLQIKNRVGLVTYAYKNGLVSITE